MDIHFYSARLNLSLNPPSHLYTVCPSFTAVQLQYYATSPTTPLRERLQAHAQILVCHNLPPILEYVVVTPLRRWLCVVYHVLQSNALSVWNKLTRRPWLWSSKLGFSSDSTTLCVVLTPTGGMLMGLDADPAVCRAMLAPYHRLMHNTSLLPRGLATSPMPPTLTPRMKASPAKGHEMLLEAVRPLSPTSATTKMPLEPAWSALLFHATVNATAMQDQATQLASELQACDKDLDMSQWRVQRSREDQQFAVQRLQEVFQEKEQCLLDVEEAGKECVGRMRKSRMVEVVWWLMVLRKNGGVNGKGGVCGAENWTEFEKDVGGRESGREGAWGMNGHVG